MECAGAELDAELDADGNTFDGATVLAASVERASVSEKLGLSDLELAENAGALAACAAIGMESTSTRIAVLADGDALKEPMAQRSM